VIFSVQKKFFYKNDFYNIAFYYRDIYNVIKQLIKIGMMTYIL